MSGPHRVSINLPDDVPTVFADFASIWHTQDVFVLDFVAQQAPAQAVADDVEGTTFVTPATVVQRVRIPPRQVFELMKAMESQLSAWEAENGKPAT